jgi:hypothetical protein
MCVVSSSTKMPWVGIVNNLRQQVVQRLSNATGEEGGGTVWLIRTELGHCTFLKTNISPYVHPLF